MNRRPAVFRRDIQGLRAVAVVVVVLDHLCGWPSGGFVGVDIFFVISGFLITGLMLRERERTGRVSWVGFYRRRIRRIIPVAIMVLSVTVLMSYIVYPSIRARLIRGDAAWAAVFLSNWHFIQAKTDYFNNEALTSPLQQFWSLAVEEQFYLFWPVVVIAVSVAMGRRAGFRRTLGVLVAVATATSLAYALSESVQHPTSAYFSTLTRAWELGIGALLAVISPWLAGLPRRVRTPLAWMGLAGILLGLALINADSVFPAPWALLPVLATAMVIAAGTGGSGPGPAPLTNGLAQYVGDISYSIYLWHFPTIIIIADFSPGEGPWVTLMTVATICVLSILSFHFVEDPIRRSTWLEGAKSTRCRVRYIDAFDRSFPRRAGYLTLGMAVLSTAAFASNMSNRSEVPEAQSAVANVSTSTKGREGTFEDRLQAKIESALAATVFPSLSPDVDHLDDNKAPQWDHCGTTGPWNAAKCTYGLPDSPRTAAVIGDSIALSWLPGLIRAFNNNGYRVHSYVAGHCPAADVKVGDGSDAESCAKHREWSIQAIRDLKPDIIVLSDASFLIPTLTDHAKGKDAVKEWQAGATKTLDRLTKVAPTVVLSSPPGSKNLINCLTIKATPSSCNGTLKAAPVKNLKKAEVSASRATGAKYIDVSDLFCGSNGKCPSFVGNTPVYVDGDHLTREYSRLLAPGLAHALGLKKR